MQLKPDEAELLQLLVANLRDYAIIMLDPQGYVISWSSAAEQMKGWKSEEIIGQHFSKFYLAEVVEQGKVESELRIATLEGRFEEQGWRVRKDGTHFWANVSITCLRTIDGEVRGFGKVTRDLTERHLAEGLQERLYSAMQERERMAIDLRFAQKLESIGRLAAGVAHEINTPIQYVGDSLEFLQSAVKSLESVLTCYRNGFQRVVTEVPFESLRREIQATEAGVDLPFLRDEIPKAFQRTIQGVKRVTEIVQAMKEFSHSDSAEQARADLNHAIATTVVVGSNEYKYHARIETSLGNLPEVVCCVGELIQVLLNLIVNAAHAIQESGQTATTGLITIATRTANEEVSISITDNGCGISEQNLEKIFDPFFTTKEIGRGTGQGLAIARAIIVERHGGRIELKSALGVGTSFTLYLPIAGKAVAVSS